MTVFDKILRVQCKLILTSQEIKKKLKFTPGAKDKKKNGLEVFLTPCNFFSQKRKMYFFFGIFSFVSCKLCFPHFSYCPDCYE